MVDIIWRPYQVECKKAIKDNYDAGINKQLIVAATGVGKRLMAVNLIQHFKRSLFIAHREELIMQAYHEIEQYFPMNVGIIKGPVFEIDKKIVVASVQTLTNRLDRIDPDTFQLVIVDECFPAGTKVDGINIEDFKVGYSINSFNHETGQIEKSKVIRIIKRKYSGKLYDFGYFKCTPNHPIFIVGIGYCLAKEIYLAYLCRKMMCYVENITKIKMSKLWKNLRIGRIRTEKESIHRSSKKRWWMLFSKMQKGIFQQSIFNNYGKNEYEICFCKNEDKQSDVTSRNSRKDEKENTRKNVLVARRKREYYKTTTNTSRSDKSSNRVSYKYEQSSITREMPSKLLQSGSGLSRSKISNRDRRLHTFIEALEILRQKEDGSIEKFRLDYIKIQKPRCRQESGKDYKENYVYNLEVKKNNNYFANSVLVHNCHHYMAKTYLKVARYWNCKLLTGWTATPKRLDGLSLSNLVDKIVFEYAIQNGITDGFLSPIEAYQIKTSTDISRVKRTAGDFNLGQLSEAVDSELRNNLIVQKYKQYVPGRQAIVYCVDIDHAYNLRGEFRKNGINCETVVSDTNRCPNRTELVKAFRKGEITVLTNVEILTEGFDYNDIGSIIMARPTQSETLYVQCIGRGTRIKSPEFVAKNGSDVCVVLDFVDNTGRLSLVNAYELEKDTPISDRMFLPKAYKEKLLLEEKKRRERRIALGIGADQKIDLLKLPEVKVWDSAKMLEPATEKQLAWLQSAGIYAEDIEYTKKQASELISNLNCHEWQLRYLAINGYDVTHGATIGQFQRVKSYIDNKQKYAMDEKERNKIERGIL